jgi:hypothetical protein
MASGTNSSASKIATLAVIIPILILGWFAAPWFLPVWRWQNVDFQVLAKQSSIPETELRTEFNMVVFYNPRASGDPIPWQIVECTPSWRSVNPEHTDEEKLLVRTSLISERDGEPISKVWVGGTGEERFFSIRGWRFPPGSFGKNAKRPVVVYQGFSLEKKDINFGMTKKSDISGWETDDTWRDRDDGWRGAGR